MIVQDATETSGAEPERKRVTRHVSPDQKRKERKARFHGRTIREATTAAPSNVAKPAVKKWNKAGPDGTHGKSERTGRPECREREPGGNAGDANSRTAGRSEAPLTSPEPPRATHAATKAQNRGVKKAES